MRSRVAIASVVALLLVVAYVRAQQFGNQPAKLNIVKVKDDLFVRTRVHEMLMQKESKDEISAVLKSDFQGAQLVFPGLLDGLLTELQ